MEAYSCIDIRPTLESFSKYKGACFDKLVPYQVPFLVASNGALRMSVPVPRRVSFTGYSKNGVKASQRGDKYFIHVLGAASKDSEEKNLHWMATEVSRACVDIWRIMGRYVLNKLGLERKAKQPKPSIRIQAGLPDLKDSLALNWTYEYTLFLHNEWTSLHRYDEELDSVRPTDIEAMTKTSESYFRFGVSIKTFDFQHYPLDDIITINCFVNLNDITWIEGIQFRPQEEMKKAKQEKIDAIEADVRNFKMRMLDSISEKGVDKKVDSILDSQPAPTNPQDKAERLYPDLPIGIYPSTSVQRTTKRKLGIALSDDDETEN